MEEKRVVTTDPTVVPADQEVVETSPDTVVERVPTQVVESTPATRRTVLADDDPLANAYAASQLIQTIVWAIVVLVLLIVALWALHVYAHLF